MKRQALPPLTVPTTHQFPGKKRALVVDTFSTDEEARLRCALEEGEEEEEDGDLSVLENCPKEPREIIKHLSAILRSDSRLSRAPLAWFLVHRKLADAFCAGGDLNSTKSAVFHLQQALKGLERVKSKTMQNELPRIEIDMARCFGDIADTLPPPQRRRRRREAIEREMKAADSALIHAKELSDSSKDVALICEACEEKAASCIRRFNYSRERSLSAALLEDAIASLTEATESSTSPRNKESLGRLAECFLARAAFVGDTHKQHVEALQNAHKTIRKLQKTIEDKDSFEYAELQVAIAHVLASQLLNEEKASKRDDDAAVEKVLKLTDASSRCFDDDDRRRHDGQLVSLRCLEAQMFMLKDSREEALLALQLAAKSFEEEKNLNKLPDALRNEILRGIAFLADDPLQALEQLRVNSLNPDAACVCDLELARAYFHASRLDDAHAAVFRSLRLAFDVLRRSPLEADTQSRATLDAATHAIVEIVDLGVDIEASRIRRDHADELKTSGAWLWLPHKREGPCTDIGETENSKRGQIEQAAFDLLRLIEALAGLADIQSLGPILWQRIKQGLLPDSLMKSATAVQVACAKTHEAARNEPYLSRPPILAPQPVPVVSSPSAESTILDGTLADHLKHPPFIFRTPTTKMKSDPDRSEATAAATTFARLLEENEDADFFLSCIGCALRLKTNEDFATLGDECVLTWSVCGQGKRKNLVGVALCSRQTGIFFTSWDDDRNKELDAEVSRIRCERGHAAQSSAAHVSRLLKLDALIAGLPDHVEHLVVVLPAALANVPVHALPIRKSEAGESIFMCDRFTVRYATSGASVVAANRRCSKRRDTDNTPLNPLLALTKAKDKKGHGLKSLLSEAIATTWKGPRVEITDSDQLLTAIEWSKSQEKKIADIRNDLKYARGLHLETISQGLDSAGGVPALACGEHSLIASKVANGLLERATMVVLSHGYLPRLDKTSSTPIPTAMLCAGSNAVVTSLWDIPSRGGQKAELARAILTTVLWQKFTSISSRSTSRQVAKAVRAATCWVRKATIRDVREFVDALPLHDVPKRDFRSVLHAIFGPQAGNANDQTLFAPDAVDWSAYACFGDGYAIEGSRTSTRRHRRRFSSDLVAKAVPSHLLARVMPSIVKHGDVLQKSNCEVESDFDAEEDDDDELLADIDETGSEIVQEWLSYAETREGRLLVGELGPEKALQAWRRANRRRHATKAVGRAIRNGQKEAIAIARESRKKAVELREKFRDAGGDEAIERAKIKILSKTRTALLAAQWQAKSIAQSQAVQSICRHPVVQKVGNSPAVKKSKSAAVETRKRAVALVLKGKQRVIAAREEFREAGGDEAMRRARDKVVAATKRFATTAGEELAKLRRSHVLQRYADDETVNEQDAVREKKTRIPS